MAADARASDATSTEELPRLRRIEAAEMAGRRSATSVLSAIAELRAALKQA